MSNTEYHIPVLLKESVDAMITKKDGVYVDLTFGGGGHSSYILSQLDGGQLYSFDQDDDAAKNAELIKDDAFNFIDGNFRHVKKYLKMYGIKKVDGILGDLGVSSHQFDETDRGFTYRNDSALDMRMNRASELTAADILNTYDARKLQDMFSSYGEVRNAKTLAERILSARANKKFETSDELLQVLEKIAPRHKEMKYYSQVFQSLRIEVNEEMEVLEELLLQTADLLNEGGVLSIMSYHSLEDRMVKNFFAKGKFSGELVKDIYGNVLKPFDAMTRKPIIADEEELVRNPRSRSVRLRLATRNNQPWEKID